MTGIELYAERKRRHRRTWTLAAIVLGLGFGLEVSGTVIETTPLITDLTGAPGAAWWLTGGVFGPEASFVTTAVLLIGTIVLIVRGRTRDHGVEAAPAEA